MKGLNENDTISGLDLNISGNEVCITNVCH